MQKAGLQVQTVITSLSSTRPHKSLVKQTRSWLDGRWASSVLVLLCRVAANSCWTKPTPGFCEKEFCLLFCGLGLLLSIADFYSVLNKGSKDLRWSMAAEGIKGLD